MPAFLIDAASFQGNVNWWTVAVGCSGGWEKVTQGTTYANPFWPAAKVAMQAQLPRGFCPGAYVFLEDGDGGVQADWFAQHAGSLDGFGLAIDAEPSFGLRRLAHAFPEVASAMDLAMVKATIARATSMPSKATVDACYARLQHHYPGKPIAGYYPHWAWGEAIPACDWLWASNYVIGQGRPQDLYAHVQPAQWAPYGGRHPALLQFTASASVPGVNGLVDCSAFEGGDLAALLTGTAGPGGQPKEATMTAPAWLPNTRSVPVPLDNQVVRLRFLGLGTGETLKLDWMSGASPDQPTGSVDVSYALGAEGVKVPAATKTTPRPDGVRVVRGALAEGVTDYPLLGIVFLY